MPKNESKQTSDNRLKCSFCGKSQDQVSKIIAGRGVYICNECVGLCNEILDEENIETAAGTQKGRGRRKNLDEPEGSAVSFFSADLRYIEWLTKDDWRGEPAPGANPERHKLVESAATALETLIDYDLQNKITYEAEPILRALLCLKEQCLGNGNPELLSPLRKLANLYYANDQYHLAAGVLEWYLEIASKDDQFDKTAVFKATTRLIKLYIKLNRTFEADYLLDSLTETIVGQEDDKGEPT